MIYNTYLFKFIYYILLIMAQIGKIIITVSIIIVVISTLLLLWYKKEEMKYFRDDLRTIYSINDPIPVSSNLRDIKIFVINMEKDKYKKVHMTNFLSKMGFANFEFVVPVPLEDIIIDERFNVPNSLPSHSKSLLITNYNIHQKAVSEGYPEFIIMEDDVDVFMKFPTFEEIYNDAKKVKFDILYFEFCRANCANSYKVSDYLYKLASAWCAGCCLFTNASSRKILKNFYFTEYLDGVYATLQIKGIIETYGYPIMRQKLSIHTNVGKDKKLFALCTEHADSRE
jgi:hypothetical protein